MPASCGRSSPISSAAPMLRSPGRGRSTAGRIPGDPPALSSHRPHTASPPPTSPDARWLVRVLRSPMDYVLDPKALDREGILGRVREPGFLESPAVPKATRRSRVRILNERDVAAVNPRCFAGGDAGH